MQPEPMTDREFWAQIRRAHLMAVAAIERRWGFEREERRQPPEKEGQRR